MIQSLRIFAALLMVAPVQALAKPADREVGSWVVSANEEDKGCSAMTSYGETHFVVSFEPGQDPMYLIFNSNWQSLSKLADQIPLSITFHFGDGPPDARRVTATNVKTDTPALIFQPESSFHSQFISAASMVIRNANNNQLVGNLTLDGTWPMNEALDECISKRKGERG